MTQKREKSKNKERLQALRDKLSSPNAAQTSLVSRQSELVNSHISSPREDGALQMRDISVEDSSRLLDAPLREKAKDMQDEMNKTEDL